MGLQLAYQTDEIQALKNILDTWRLESIQPFVRQSLRTVTTGLFAVRDDAMILAFAGTDPGIWQTIATDAHVVKNDLTEIHSGFEAAFDVASGDVDAAINLVQGKRLFITGHSLGGALAALAANMLSPRASHPAPFTLSGCRVSAAIVFVLSIHLHSDLTLIGSFMATISSHAYPCRVWASITSAARFNAMQKLNSTLRRLCPLSARTSRDFHRSSTASPNM